MGDPIETAPSSKPIPEETICAIATPMGESGIGVVRMSGPEALEIAEAMFQSPSGMRLTNAESHTVHVGWVIDPKNHTKIDEVLVTVMRAPRTYTRENTIEISGHGGPLPLRRICEVLLETGARLAEPGEFTKRAFLNGRIDLTQAEAVIDMIRSKTEVGLQAAVRQLSGQLGRHVKELKERLVRLLAGLEAMIDFPEEGLTFASADEMRRSLLEIAAELEGLLATADDGRLIREGVTIAIIGRPNVGKSSLLNRLLAEDRAIVTSIPGTTRDLLEEYVNVHGVPVRLIDTAGIRESRDPIEAEGVRRTRQAIERSALLLLVLDRNQPLEQGDLDLMREFVNKPRIHVVNKMDLPAAWTPDQHEGLLEEFCQVSCRTGEGLDRLRFEIAQRLLSGRAIIPERPLLTTLRQKNACYNALKSLSYSIKSLESAAPPELVAADLRAGIDNLGIITGETTTEDLLDALFRDFCIGK